MEADVVVADRLAPRELLAELPADTEIVDVAKLPARPFGAAGADQPGHRRARARREARGAVQGRRQLRLRSRLRGGHRLPRGGCPRDRDPGISSPLAVPAVAGIPVTHRGVTHDLVIVSGHLPPGHPDSLVQWGALASLAAPSC